MIDLHAHLLPGLDDGARSWEEALAMARTAAESGIEVVAATCHANLPGEDSLEYRRTYRRQLLKLQSLLKEHRIPLKVVEGMELLDGPDLIRKLKRGELLTINQTRYVLTEVRLDAPAWQIYRLLLYLLESGYIPILAHPERYRCMQRMPAHAKEWADLGAVLQIDKGSVLGRFGEEPMKASEYLLGRQLAMLAASDAHRADRRTIQMIPFRDFLARRYGRGCPELLLRENPSRIQAGEAIIRL